MGEISSFAFLAGKNPTQWISLREIQGCSLLPERHPTHWSYVWDKSKVVHFSHGEIQHIGFLPGRNPKLCISPREKGIKKEKNTKPNRKAREGKRKKNRKPRREWTDSGKKKKRTLRGRRGKREEKKRKRKKKTRRKKKKQIIDKKKESRIKRKKK